MDVSSENVKDAFAFISERGVLGGLYLGSIIFSLVLGTPTITAESGLLPWAIAVCLLIGLIIANVTYELLLPMFQFLTNWIARLAFKRQLRSKTTSEEQQHFSKYDQVRTFRELFLASEGDEHLKERIKKDEKLRQTLTYFATASLAAAAITYIAATGFEIDPDIKTVDSGVVIYILIASLVGQAARSYSFGRSVGLAFVGTPSDKRTALMQ